MNTSSNRRTVGLDLPGSAWGLPRDLEDLLDRFGRWTGWDVGRSQSAQWMPVAEEDETADAYRVRIELPGIPREQVGVEVEGRQLCVRGDLGEDTSQGDTYLTHRSGSFLYRTSLPADADLDSIQAALKDGVLTVTVPRSSATGRRSVPIGGAAGAGDVIAGETTDAIPPSSAPNASAPNAGTGSTSTGTTSTATGEPRIDRPAPGEQTDGS